MFFGEKFYGQPLTKTFAADRPSFTLIINRNGCKWPPPTFHLWKITVAARCGNRVFGISLAGL